MINKLNKRRKLLMLLPFMLLGIFFIGLFAVKFTTSLNKPSQGDSTTQLNIQLPEANIKEKGKTKLEIYMQSRQDSIKQKEELNNPSFKRFFNSGPLEKDSNLAQSSFTTENSPQLTLAIEEKKVNDQLNKILQQLNHPPNDSINKYPITADHYNQDVSHLESLMTTLQTDSASDPELQKLDGMLDKLIRLQNPGQYGRKERKDSTAYLYDVSSQRKAATRPSTVFFGLESNNVNFAKQKSAIRAVVTDDRTVVDGSTIKLSLLENIFIGQMEIPANNDVFGICSINNERVEIQIDKIVYNNIIYPINLKVFDVDGIPGISAPGAITRDGAKEALENTMQTLSMGSLDPSIAAQATNAGIQSLKSMLSRKIKQVKANIKAGHLVFLQ